jgi:cell division protein FtsQ
MKKLKDILIWVFVVAYLAVSMSFVTKKRRSVVCHSINVSIMDSSRNQFVTQSDIIEFLRQPEMHVVGNPITSINTKKLEKEILNNHSVKNAEVFLNISGKINVEVIQRKPIVRVINKKGESYYIDQEGAIMPLYDKYASHVLIANGYIVEPFEVNRTHTINCGNNERDPEKKKNMLICDLFKLCKFIDEHKFWKAQIEQVYVNDEMEFELIPRVGAHQIFFGDIENYKVKFRNLEAFYHQGLNNVGWNKYDKINLKFDNQVICTKR